MNVADVRTYPVADVMGAIGQQVESGNPGRRIFNCHNSYYPTWVLADSVGGINLVDGPAEVVRLRVGGLEDLSSGADSSATTRVPASGTAKGTTASGMPARRRPRPRAPHRSAGRRQAVNAPNRASSSPPRPAASPNPRSSTAGTARSPHLSRTGRPRRLPRSIRSPHRTRARSADTPDASTPHRV